MQGDIALAGFVLTKEEWQALDAVSRAQLVQVAMLRSDAPTAAGSGPIELVADEEIAK
ncbi:MAG: hypothetical protein ABI175_04880 [Polyangiales bacterium]